MITSTSVKSKKFERKLLTKMRKAMKYGWALVRSEKGQPLFDIRFECNGFYVYSYCSTKEANVVRAIQRAKPFQAIRHRLVPWDSRPATPVV